MVRNKYLFVLIFFLLITKSYSLELEGNWQLINADKTKVKVENNRKLTISLGVATTNKLNQMEAIELIKKADKNLYISKRTGRNKVTGTSDIN